MELDTMVGAVGRLGRCVNVPTPMCDLLYAILLPYKNGPRGVVTCWQPGSLEAWLS